MALNACCKLVLSDWNARGTSPSKDSKKSFFFAKPWQRWWTQSWKEKKNSIPSKRQRVAELFPFPVPSEVDPPNLDFDVNQSSVGQVPILWWPPFVESTEEVQSVQQSAEHIWS